MTFVLEAAVPRLQPLLARLQRRQLQYDTPFVAGSASSTLLSQVFHTSAPLRGDTQDSTCRLVTPAGVVAQNSEGPFARTTAVLQLTGLRISAVLETLGTEVSTSVVCERGGIALPQLDVGFLLEPCLEGESTSPDGQRCVSCTGSSTFSWAPQSDECTPCPPDALCLNGSTVVARKGFYRATRRSLGLSKCFPSSICDEEGNVFAALGAMGAAGGNSSMGGGGARRRLQVSETGTEVDVSLCSKGHTGRLCAQCEPGYGHDGNLFCVKCGGQGRIAAFVILGILVLALVVGYMVRSAVNEGREEAERAANSLLLTLARRKRRRASIEALQALASTHAASSEAQMELAYRQQRGIRSGGASSAARGSSSSDFVSSLPTTDESLAVQPSAIAVGSDTASEDALEAEKSRAATATSSAQKILFSHLQVLGILSWVELDWPPLFTGLFAIF